jgi:small subunit ribosomal protein S8
MNDNLSNMLSTIKNGYIARLTSVRVPYSKICLNVLDALERGGYIRGYKYENTNSENSHNFPIMVLLKYHENQPSICNMYRISSSGRRIYSPSKNLKSFNNGLGAYIISSSKGVLLDSEAKSLGIGGEIICKLY